MMTEASTPLPSSTAQDAEPSSTPTTAADAAKATEEASPPTNAPPRDIEPEAETWVARPVSLPAGIISKLPPPVAPPVRSPSERARMPSVAPEAAVPSLTIEDDAASDAPGAPLPAFRLDTDAMRAIAAKSASPDDSSDPAKAAQAGARATKPTPSAFQEALEAKTDPRWLVSGAGYLVVLLVASLVLRAVHAQDRSSHDGQPATARDGAPSRVASLPARVFAACAVDQRARVLSHVVREVPVEMRATGDRVWVGAATEVNHAEGFVVDRAHLAKEPSVEVQSIKPIRRIGALGASTDEFWVSTEGDERKMWPLASWGLPLEGDARVEAVRSVATPLGTSVVFRRQGEIYGASVDATGAARHAPTKIAGVDARTPGAGLPTIGFNGRDIAVVFGDRASSDEAWRVRLAHARAGEIPAQSQALTIPSGGPGGPTITPSILGLSDGRWLFAWTEGDDLHVVRAQTLDPDFHPVGEPFNVSTPDTNAGQPVLAVTEGRGAIAYLASKRPSFELWMASINCP